MKTHISLAKEDKNYTKEERIAVIEKDKAELEKAKAVEEANKAEISKLIATAEKYLADHYDKEYYQKVVASCEAEKEIATAEYKKKLETLKAEHNQIIAKLSDKQEIKDEKYVYKNRVFDAQMVHESKLQEIKDRKHDAYAHKYHLIDLLRMSKFTRSEERR